MNVLVITQYFWPEEFRINDFVESLVGRKHQVTVLTGIPNYPEGRYFPGYGVFKNLKQNYKGAQVYRIPILPRGKKNNIRLALNYLSFVLSGFLLAPLYCRKRYDLIFVFEISPITVALPAILMKKIKRAPLLLWVLDLWPESLSAAGAVKSPLIIKWAGKLVRFIYKNTDLVLVASKAFIPSVERMGGRQERIRYLPNWGENVYELGQSDNKLAKEVAIPHGFKVMFAGNIGVSQDFGTILKAAEKVKDYRDIHWLILGEGRMGDWVKGQIMKRKLTNVHLLGRHPIEAMPTFFSLADAMLVTLKRDQIFSLTIPGKIQSYLVCGKPIIACLDGEGNSLIRQAQAGLTCAAEDPDGLASLVLEMYRLPAEKRQEMGSQGKKYYDQNFKRAVLFDNLESWMEDAAHFK